MKYIMVCCDGMSDRPIPELGGRTCMEEADKPNMDDLARRGRCGLLKTMYENLPLDSGVANMSLLGYDPKEYYPGRGSLEALNMQLDFTGGDLAFRCNTVSASDVMEDYSAGHMPNEDSHEVMGFIQEELGSGKVSFHAGVMYRHVALVKGVGSDVRKEDLACTPPHDIVGEPVKENLIEGKTPAAEELAGFLNDLMLQSRNLLKDHPVNVRRRSEGKNAADMIWLWGPGHYPRIPSFKDTYGLSGSLISAVDLLKGIGCAVGLDVVNVLDATGYLDTNYEGKADAALEALEHQDFVYIHIESTDESGHEGSVEHKIQAIEDIDGRVVGRLLDRLGGDYGFAVTPDHATPITVRGHTDDPVPFLVYKAGVEGDDVESYTEAECARGSLGTRPGTDLMRLLTGAI